MLERNEAVWVVAVGGSLLRSAATLVARCRRPLSLIQRLWSVREAAQPPDQLAQVATMDQMLKKELQIRARVESL